MATGNEKNFELRIGKTGLIVVIAGMTALLCAAFLFGIDVGENIDVCPGKIVSLPQRALALVWRPAKVKLAQSTPENKAKQNQKAAVDAASAGENIDLTFYNTLTGKKGVSGEDKSLEKQPVTGQPKNEEETQKGKFVIDSQKKPDKTIEEIIGENKSPEEKKLTEEKKESPDSTSKRQKYIVQAGSMKEKSKADEMNKKISSLGFKSEIIKAKVNGKGMMFRVVASGFDDKEKADEAAKKITKETGSNCIVRKTGSEKNQN
jgi:cell division septation protein DedD